MHLVSHQVSLTVLLSRHKTLDSKVKTNSKTKTVIIKIETKTKTITLKTKTKTVKILSRDSHLCDSVIGRQGLK